MTIPNLSLTETPLRLQQVGPSGERSETCVGEEEFMKLFDVSRLLSNDSITEILVRVVGRELQPGSRKAEKHGVFPVLNDFSVVVYLFKRTVLEILGKIFGDDTPCLRFCLAGEYDLLATALKVVLHYERTFHMLII